MLGVENVETENGCSRQVLSAADAPEGLDWRAVWQLTSMSLGIGLFAIPYCFLLLGYVQAAFLVVVMGLLANTALQRLLDISLAHDTASYEALAELAFGRAGKVAMTVITMITTTIATLSYLSASKGLLVSVAIAFLVDVDVNVNHDAAGNPIQVEVLGRTQSVVVLFFLVCMVSPMLLSRSMGDSAWISAGGVFSISLSALFFVGSCLAVLAGGCKKEPCHPAPPALAGSAAEILQYMATLAFSFSMVFALFPVLADRAAQRSLAGAVKILRPAVRTSISFSVSIYLLVGFMGVLTFGTDTESLALQNLDLTQPLPQLISLVVGSTSLLLVAIVAFPALQSLELLISMACPTFQRDIRAGLVVGACLFFALVDAFLDTKVAFALTGSLGLALGAYVMPCLLYLRLEDPHSASTAGHKWRRIGAVLVMLYGCVLLFGSTPATVWNLLQPSPTLETKSLQELICSSQRAEL